MNRTTIAILLTLSLAACAFAGMVAVTSEESEADDSDLMSVGSMMQKIKVTADSDQMIVGCVKKMSKINVTVDSDLMNVGSMMKKADLEIERTWTADNTMVGLFPFL